METYFKGEEIKFAINIEADGFDMDTDGFLIEVFSSSKGSVSAEKSETIAPEAPLVIFAEQDGEDPEAKPQWYAIVDTKTLGAGTLRVISTALVTDAQANDGVRRQVDVADLCYLKDPKKR